MYNDESIDKTQKRHNVHSTYLNICYTKSGREFQSSENEGCLRLLQSASMTLQAESIDNNSETSQGPQYLLGHLYSLRACRISPGLSLTRWPISGLTTMPGLRRGRIVSR